MKEELLKYISSLKKDNEIRSEKMKSCSDYDHTAHVHVYNNNLIVIKRLEEIVNK